MDIVRSVLMRGLTNLSINSRCKVHGKEIHPNCPECMELWCKFLDKNDFYVCGVDGCQIQVHKDFNKCDEHFDY